MGFDYKITCLQKDPSAIEGGIIFINFVKIVIAINGAVKLSDGFGESMNDFDEKVWCIFILSLVKAIRTMYIPVIF